MTIKTSILIAALVFGAAGNARGAETAAETAIDEIEAALEVFTASFNDLDWPVFRSTFTEDATVFAPFSLVPTRTTVEGCFKPIFERVKASRTGPPYLNIEPRDVEIQLFGETAVVTFHLRDLLGRPAGELSRRTAVLIRSESGWRIAHLHASSLMEDQAQAPQDQ